MELAELAFRNWGMWVMRDRARYRTALARCIDAVPAHQGDPSLRSYVPINEIECSKTDDFVRTLDEPLRSTVVTVYTCEAPIESIARTMHVSKATVYERLRVARSRYMRRLDDERAKRDAMHGRERYEQWQTVRRRENNFEE